MRKNVEERWEEKTMASMICGNVLNGDLCVWRILVYYCPSEIACSLNFSSRFQFSNIYFFKQKSSETGDVHVLFSLYERKWKIDWSPQHSCLSNIRVISQRQTFFHFLITHHKYQKKKISKTCYTRTSPCPSVHIQKTTMYARLWSTCIGLCSCVHVWQVLLCNTIIDQRLSFTMTKSHDEKW